MAWRWEQTSYLPRPDHGPGVMIIPDTVWVGRFIYPAPCRGRVPRGQTPPLGDPASVATAYGSEWVRYSRNNTLCGHRVIDMATMRRSTRLYRSIRQAQQAFEQNTVEWEE